MVSGTPSTRYRKVLTMTFWNSGSASSSACFTPMNPTANGERMSVLRMSVKLIPRLASTGPAVNTRNSTRNGRARTHAATACCRRVGSTCLDRGATGGWPRARA